MSDDWFKWVAGVVVIWAATLFCAGCALWKRTPPAQRPSEAATALLASLQQVNHSLRTFKGLGTISILRNDIRQTFRAAWAAAEPDQLRFQLLAPTGQPVLSVASDGRYYYFLSHDRGRVVRKQVSSSGLKRLVDIPLGTPELFMLLGGRATLPEAVAVANWMEDGSAQAPAVVINYQKPLRYDRLFLDDHQTGIRKLERLNKTGQLVWWVEFVSTQMADGYRIPRRMILAAANGARVEFDIERFWANPAVSPEMFIIKPP